MSKENNIEKSMSKYVEEKLNNIDIYDLKEELDRYITIYTSEYIKDYVRGEKGYKRIESIIKPKLDSMLKEIRNG